MWEKVYGIPLREILIILNLVTCRYQKTFVSLRSLVHFVIYKALDLIKSEFHPWSFHIPSLADHTILLVWQQNYCKINLRIDRRETESFTWHISWRSMSWKVYIFFTNFRVKSKKIQFSEMVSQLFITMEQYLSEESTY